MRLLPLSLLGLAASLLGACATAPRPVSSVTVVADPGPFASLEAAANGAERTQWWDADTRDDDACTTGFAAAELARFLPACFGLPAGAVRRATTLPDTGDVVVLGNSRTSALVRSLTGAADAADTVSGAFRVRSLERGGRRVIVIAGDDRAGVLYGAYALLDRLGMRFPGLGEAGRVDPARAARWPRLALRERPSFATRGFWAWEPRGDREFFLWMARNRMNLWTAADTAYVQLMKQLAIRASGGGHTIQAEFLSPQRYFAAHPEWFGLHDGRRSPTLHAESGDNFCTSNAEARHTLASNLVAALDHGSLRHVDDLELWMLDGGRWCECDACRAQGSPTDRLLDVAADVDAAVDSAWRQGRLGRRVEVATLAYLETLAPPRRDHRGAGAPMVVFFPYFRCYAHALFDSTCVEINRRLALAYRGWEAVPATWGVCEYYDVGAFKSLPLVFPHVMAADLARYARSGERTRFEYMHAPTRAWGCWTLNHWLLSRLTWDAGRDPDTLVADFCHDYFPASSAAMRQHYRWLEKASANILALQHCVGVFGTNAAEGGRLTQPSARLFPLQHLQPAESHPTVNDAPDLDEIEGAMREARAALDRARALAGSPVESGRLAEEEHRFAYGEAMFAFYAGLIRTAQSARNGDAASAREAFAAVERAAQTLRGVTDLVQVSASHANAKDGLEASGVTATYRYFRERYGR